MKKFKLKGWHFWLAYGILMIAMIALLTGCAVTRPDEMRFAKELKVKHHKELSVIHCNSE